MDARIQPIDFTADVAALTRQFVRRSCFDERFQDWLAGPKPFMLIIGKPGSGKSALAAELSTRRDVQTVRHFCLTGRSSTINPGTTLRSLAAQLTLTVAGFDLALANTVAPHLLQVHADIKISSMTGGAAAAVIIKNLYSPDPLEELEALIGRPLRAMPPLDGRSLIIILDGLDEAVGQGVATPLPVLISRMSDLPAWVRVLCTSRPDRRVLSHFDDIASVRLDLDAPEYVEDVRTYARARLSGLREDNAKSNAGARIEAAAQGNFLVARSLLDEIEAGDREPGDEDFPRTLDEIYRRSIRRFSDDDWRDFLQPILGTLSVAREPLREWELAGLAQMNATKLRRQLGILQQFLVVYEAGGNLIERTFRLYHQAFREFLQDERNNEDFLCAAPDQHLRIAQYYEANVSSPRFTGLEATPYYWKHFVAHLQDSGATLHQLTAYFFNGDWLFGKLQATSPEALVADFEHLSEIAPEALSIASALRQSTHVLKQSPQQLSSHLCGRLLENGVAFLDAFVTQLAASTSYPWLKPVARCLALLDGPLRVTIPLGGDAIEAIAIAADGTWALAAAGEDLNIVDLESGQVLHKWAGHSRQIYSAAMDGAGRRAITSGADGAVRIWDLKTRTELCSFACGTHQNAKVAIALDVGIARDAERWRAWSLTTGEEVAPPPGGGELIVGRGAFVIAEDGHGAIATWSVIEGGAGRVLEDRYPYTADIREDGQVAVLMRKGELVLRELASGRLLRTWEAAEDDGKTYHHVAFLEGGSKIVSISGPYESESPAVSIWRADTGECVRELQGHHTMVTAMATQYSGSLCVTGTIDGELKVWDLSRETVAHRPGHSSALNAVAFVDGRSLLSGGEDGHVMLWDTANGTSSRSDSTESEIVSLVAVDAETFAVLSKRGEMRLRRLDTFEDVWARSNLGRGYGVCLSPSADTLYLLSSAGITQWDRSGNPIAGWCPPTNFDGLPFGGGGPRAVVMAILPGPPPRAVVGYGAGDSTLSDDWDFPALVLDLEAHAVTAAITQKGSPGKRAVGWMEDGRLALAAHKNIKIWDTETGDVVETFNHPGDVTGIALLVERDLGVSVCSDGVVRLWSLSSRKVIAEIRLDESATCCAIAPDVSMVAVGDWTGGVHLFQVSGLVR